MPWSAVPFGKYKGKTFPEIIVRDPDWFLWVVPKLYGKLADEAARACAEGANHQNSKSESEAFGGRISV